VSVATEAGEEPSSNARKDWNPEDNPEQCLGLSPNPPVDAGQTGTYEWFVFLPSLFFHLALPVSAEAGCSRTCKGGKDRLHLFPLSPRSINPFSAAVPGFNTRHVNLTPCQFILASHLARWEGLLCERKTSRKFQYVTLKPSTKLLDEKNRFSVLGL
jgi:hypothetical protein